jgi:hypothetical protein
MRYMARVVCILVVTIHVADGSAAWWHQTVCTCYPGLVPVGTARHGTGVRLVLLHLADNLCC